jgi:ABC-type multidrug transport system permease subunit
VGSARSVALTAPAPAPAVATDEALPPPTKPAAAEPAAPPPSLLPGAALQAAYFASPAWAAARAALDATDVAGCAATAAAATSASAPRRRYPAFPTQVAALAARGFRSAARDTTFSGARLFGLLGLALVIGVVWFRLLPAADDLGGMHSVVSVVFLATLFSGVLNMMTSLGVLLRERPVALRERASGMYGPVAHAAALVAVEAPLLAGLVAVTVPVYYFMLAFPPSAATFFMFALTQWIVLGFFASLAQALAAGCASPAIAMATAGLVTLMLLLFGGVFYPGSQFPAHWAWAYDVCPLSHVLNALIPPLFAQPPGCVPWSTCPAIYAFSGSTYSYVDRLWLVSYIYKLPTGAEWLNIGYLAGYVAGVQALHVAASAALAPLFAAAG